MRKWSELFPRGRIIFYEGDNPKQFAADILARFGFDPSKDNPHWNTRCGFSFDCPAEHLDAIYGTGQYPMGS